MGTGAPEDPTASLVAAVSRATDLSGACSVLLQRAVDRWEFRRAAVVVDDGNGLRGLVQLGPGELVSEVSVGYGEVRPAILNAMDGRDARRIADSDGIPALGFEGCLVLPLPGQDGPGLGAVVVEANGTAEKTATALEELRYCGPAVARILELERLRTREAAASSDRELLLDMVDILPDPVVLTDRDNHILMSNRRADELLTTEADDSEGRRRAVEVNNLFLSSHLTQAAVSDPGEHRMGELNLVSPEDGTDLVFEVFSRATTDGDEKTVFTILRDITDLKKALGELEDQIHRSRAAEKRTRRESERLQAILENVGEPILVTDQSSNIILLNREAEYLFEIPEGTPEGGPEVRSIRANDTKFTSLMSEFLMRPERRWASTMELERPEEADSLPMEVVSTKIFDRRGDVTAVVSVLHDLTAYIENQRLARELQVLNQELEQRVEEATEELAERNRELESQRHMLERASRAKSEFLAGVSHELRTPINAIVGYTSLLKEGIYGDLSSQQVESLDKVQAASDQLLTLISDILDLSKIEAGKITVEPERFHLDEMTTDLVKTIEPMVKDKNLELCVDVPDRLPTICSDRNKLRQVLLNLLSNAVKFTDEGSVTLRCGVGPGEENDGEYVRMEVADTGVGIEPEELEEIFEDFHQAERTSRTARGGAGLGLAITRRLTRVLGGKIQVRSTVGEGSVFTVEIPRDLEASDLPEDARAER